MKNFFYHAPVKVLFGEGSVGKNLAAELAPCGKNIMLAYGGGSVMDCVKVISAAAKAPKDYWEMIFADHRKPADSVPWGAVVTLSGTGSEMNALGGISNKALNIKSTLPGSPASFAICDPAYLLTVPQKQMASGIFDNLSHCMETYFGGGDCVSDTMNEAVMRDIVQNARAWLKDSQNIDTLGNLMWDSSLPQTFLFGCGKEGGFQCHAIEAQLCAYTGSNHGMALAVIHPSYYRHIVKDMPERFARFGQKVFDLDPVGKTTEQLADEAVEAVATFARELGLDSTLTGLGLDVNEEILRKVSENCGIAGGMPRKLEREEIFQLLREVL